MSKNIASGGRQFRKRLELNALAGVALRNFFSAYGQTITVKAKQTAPSWRGNLRGSLTFDMEKSAGGFVQGIVLYSRSPYALYVHGYYDQRVRMSKPWSRSKPHYPPVSALKDWADDHGISPYAVQQAIGRKGTPLIPFFKIAIRDSEVEKKALLAGTALAVETKWKVSRINVKQ
ncbi:MAG: hypothetical protein Unbinned1469contig1000_7 [Prokaryotic dsDNA virus sp.]|jgi:hypothetical protein|nr:MAG: hypothetical protein Unbinned1469contig1000_7 [Prokaryotic dsDNA virus sp.]|tara:strand:- start:445 stop:969 length:525 start_codon:yes stop_codon:yes gene_type:complete